MMILKRSLAAVTVTMALSSFAHAGTSAASQQSLRSIMSVDIPNTYWVNANTWSGVGQYTQGLAGIDGVRNSFAGDPWVIGGESAACDTWAGVLCSGGEIVSLEIPFAEMHGNMSALMAALAPVKSSVRSLNLVGNYNLSGEATGLQDLERLEGLFLDNTRLSGELPDLSGLTELQYAGLNDNLYLTGLAGGIGGSSLQVLNINNTANLSADITQVLEVSKDSLQRLNASSSAVTGQIPDYSNNTHLNYFVVAGSGLGGTLNLPSAGQIASANVDTTGTGISSGSGTSGLPISPALASVSGVTAVANGANAMLVSWTGVLAADGYFVAYSADDGLNWTTETIEGGDNSSANIISLAAGSYRVQVTAYQNSTSGAAATIQSGTVAAPGSVDVSNAVTGQGGTTTGGTTTGSSSGGGGAALWLGLLPLMGFARRAGKRSSR